MLVLRTYGSSSKGNCYLLSSDTTTIMLDCGVKNIESKLVANNINGIILTHRHGDHISGIRTLKDYYNGKYYSHKEVLDILPVIKGQKVEIKKNEKFKIGDFEIMPFELHHDVTCYGYLIKDLISNTKLLYITDTGQIDYRFRDIDYFLIESNCDEDKLTYEDFKEVRLYDTHLSKQQTLNFLKQNINHNTKKIMLCHIASDEENYLSHERYIKENLDNKNIDVIAIDPHLNKICEIVLKEELKGFDFD